MFREAMGMTPPRNLLRLRVQQAQRMIKEKEIRARGYRVSLRVLESLSYVMGVPATYWCRGQANTAAKFRNRSLWQHVLSSMVVSSLVSRLSCLD
jgi:hypothetical protein